MIGSVLPVLVQACSANDSRAAKSYLGALDESPRCSGGAEASSMHLQLQPLLLRCSAVSLEKATGVTEIKVTVFVRAAVEASCFSCRAAAGEGSLYCGNSSVQIVAVDVEPGLVGHSDAPR